MNATSSTSPTVTSNVPNDGIQRPLSGRRLIVASIVAVIAAFAALGIWFWNSGAERRAIGRLPPGERSALYERTLRTLQSPCGPEKRSSGFDDFCRDQAAFILQFHECDDACAVLARAHLSSPSK